MSTRQQILKAARAHDTITTTMLRSMLAVRWSGIPVMLHDMCAKGELVRVGTGRYTTPEKAEQVRAWESTGEAAQRVLVMLAAQKRTRTECYDAAAELVGKEGARAVMQRLVRDSLVCLTNQHYTITPRGLKRVPRGPIVIAPMRPYVPSAAPPRRAGSMAHLTLPSVFSGAPA